MDSSFCKIIKKIFFCYTETCGAGGSFFFLDFSKGYSYNERWRDDLSSAYAMRDYASATID